MMLLLIVLVLTVLGLLVHEVRLDGYGRRPGPRSHCRS